MCNNDFWIGIRRKIFDDNFDGGGYCRLWSLFASKILDDLGIENIIMEYKGDALYPFTDHSWIVIPQSEYSKSMIADGTAGQFFDEDHQLGFYGTIDDISGKLKEAYSNGSHFKE